MIEALPPAHKGPGAQCAVFMVEYRSPGWWAEARKDTAPLRVSLPRRAPFFLDHAGFLMRPQGACMSGFVAGSRPRGTVGATCAGGRGGAGDLRVVRPARSWPCDRGQIDSMPASEEWLEVGRAELDAADERVVELGVRAVGSPPRSHEVPPQPRGRVVEHDQVRLPPAERGLQAAREDEIEFCRQPVRSITRPCAGGSRG